MGIAAHRPVKDAGWPSVGEGRSAFSWVGAGAGRTVRAVGAGARRGEGNGFPRGCAGPLRGHNVLGQAAYSRAGERELPRTNGTCHLVEQRVALTRCQRSYFHRVLNRREAPRGPPTEVPRRHVARSPPERLPAFAFPQPERDGPADPAGWLSGPRPGGRTDPSPPVIRPCAQTTPTTARPPPTPAPERRTPPDRAADGGEASHGGGRSCEMFPTRRGIPAERGRHPTLAKRSVTVITAGV